MHDNGLGRFAPWPQSGSSRVSVWLLIAVVCPTFVVKDSAGPY